MDATRVSKAIPHTIIRFEIPLVSIQTNRDKLGLGQHDLLYVPSSDIAVGGFITVLSESMVPDRSWT